MIGRRSTPSTPEEDKPKGFDDFELRLGDVMRGERATLSKSLLDVQRELRIKAVYIAAIESGDVSAFEAQSFISGYVRSYARYLGIDPDWAFERFCTETGFQPAHGMSPAASGMRREQPVASSFGEALARPNTPFIPEPESFWSKIELRAIGSVAVLALLAGGIGYGGWTVLREVQRVNLSPVDQTPGVVADIDPVGGTDAAADGQKLASAAGSPDMPAAVPGGEGQDRIYRPQTLDVPVLPARDGPIASIDPGLNAAPAAAGTATPAPAAQLASAAALPGDTTVAAAQPAQMVQTTGAEAPALEILAVRPSWVRIRSADGSVLLEKIMDAGERYTVPKLEQPPVLRTGESGAIYFAVNGTVHGPVGKRGQVTKKIELSPEAIDEKYAVADLSADNDLAKMVAVADASGVIPADTAPAASGE